MGFLDLKGVIFVWVLLYTFLWRRAVGNIVLIGKNISLSFQDIEANFAPSIKESGERGVLYLAEPLDACGPLKNEIAERSDSPFVLVIRGGCTFDDKVRIAQRAGFKAAIVYDNEDRSSLVAMAGTPGGIHIHAVFVSKSSGETLKEHVGQTDMELWIIPSFENSAWSIMAISFISLLAMSAVLATCFFVRRHRIRRERPRPSNIREFHGMSSRLVRAMPSLIFTSVLEDNCTSATCAICLEDYSVGEKLRILPCRHKFHAMCVDSWLTTWRTFCPVCKQDARTGTSNPSPSECTPLLSSAASSPYSSFRSSSMIAASPSTQIIPSAIRSPPTNHALPRVPNPRRFNNNSAAISISRSSTDLRNAASYYDRSRSSFHSLGYPQSSPMGTRFISSPINTRFMSPYNPSPSDASVSFLAGSSSRQSYLRRCTGSGASLSAMDSAHSLPDC